MSRKSLLKLLRELILAPDCEAWLARAVEVTGESREEIIEKCINAVGEEIIMERQYGIKAPRLERIQAEMARLGLSPTPKDRGRL